MVHAGVVVEAFDSPTAVLNAAEHRPVNDAWQGHKRDSDMKDDWGGVRSFAAAVEKAREGFTEVTEEMKLAYDTSKAYVQERIKPRQVLPINAYVGSTPNVTRAILGLPKDMRRVKMESRKVPGIEIIYETGLNCRYEDRELKERGARMLVLLSLLTMHGIPVKLDVSSCVRGLRQNTDEVLMSKYTIQGWGEPMNIRKVSYWLAHPSVLRRISFAIWETSKYVQCYDRGYGYPVTNSDSRTQGLKDLFKSEGKTFLTTNDFKTDEDIIRVWNEITGQEVKVDDAGQEQRDQY